MASSITYVVASNTIITKAHNETHPCNSSQVYDADVSNGWGVVSKQGNNQYKYDAKLQIGDGDVPTYFAEENNQILFTSGVQRVIEVTYNGHYRLGKVVSESEKLSESGSHLKTEHNSAEIYAEGSLEIYSSLLTAEGNRLTINFYGIDNTTSLKIWSSAIFQDVDTTINPSPNSIVDIYRLTAQKGTSALRPLTGIATYNDILIHSYTRAFYTQASADPIFKNIVIKNSSYIAYATFYTGDFKIINGISDNWAFFWSGTCTGEIYRQYEFDLNTTFSNATAIENANVTLSYYGEGGGTISSWLTFSNGSIPTQTLTMGFYNQTGGNTIYDYNPYSIAITKDGYQTYSKNFTLGEKTDWTIALQTETSGDGVYMGYGLAFLTLIIGLVIGVLVGSKK